jgi:hypothetical protein
MIVVNCQPFAASFGSILFEPPVPEAWKIAAQLLRLA